MNGRRCAALKRQFAKITGRSPAPAAYQLTDASSIEDGRWHNAYDHQGVVVKLETMEMVEPSEWRRLKKNIQARRAKGK